MTTATIPALSGKQMAILIVYGAILWFAAAMLIRFIAPMGALEGTARIWTYVLVIPGTIPAVLIGQRIAGLAKGQIALGLAAVTTTAVLLDGVAIAWFPTLYGNEMAHVLAGAAVILWGAGVGQALGFLMDRRADPA